MIGRVRDFTEELFGEMGDALGQDFVDNNADSWWDDVMDVFRKKELAIGEELSNINKYLKRVSEANDITKEKLNAIFTAVHGVEEIYANRTEDLNLFLWKYLHILNEFTETLKNGDVNKPLDMSKLTETVQRQSELLMEQRTKLDDQFNKAVQEALEAFFNDDGTYNWDMIEQTLQSDLNSITSIQLAALAKLYLTLAANGDMSYEQVLTKFIECGYVDETHLTGEAPNETVRYYSEMSDVMKMIAELAYQQMMLEALGTYFADNVPHNYTQEEYDSFNKRMQQAMLIKFLATYTPSTKWSYGSVSFSIDLTQFEESGKFKVHGILLNEALVGDIPELYELYSEYSAAFLFFNDLALQYGLTPEIEDWMKLGYGFMLSSALSMLTADMGTASGLIVDLSSDLLLDFFEELTKHKGKPSEDDQLKIEQLLLVMQMLGARVIGLSTTGGSFNLQVFYNTPKAIIMLAGLAEDLNLSQQEVIDILCGPKNSDYFKVFNYMNNYRMIDGGKTYNTFCTTLTDKYEEKYNLLFALFGEKYPFLTSDMSAVELPADVLQALIEL